MSDLNIKINGIDIKCQAGETVLAVARKNGIEIPTLCHDERIEAYGGCGLCVVQQGDTPRLFRACSTVVADGMELFTESEPVVASRKVALELLLSNHRGDCVAPCKTACPGDVDCQGYIGLIANNRFAEALEVMKESYPIPASLGRVCPHPCEDVCRRKNVDHPINIARLKQFAADFDLNLDDGKRLVMPTAPSTGKKVAIIGGGPAGLTMASFMAQAGHKAVIFEMMPMAGGMLRYGIPEYRLPKAVLDMEIEQVVKSGVEIRCNTKLGVDVQFSELRAEYDAIYFANGAWASSPLRCEGEDMVGVVGGVDFLGHVGLGDLTKISGTVAVVGGGNTAMDACRTAVRLGAEKVYVLYRRTQDEMPAEEIEIREAFEEGVEFKFLVAPIRVVGEDGHVTGIELQKMTLGEADASGRRSPVAVEGEVEILPVDTIISAVGQKVVPLELDDKSVELAYTPWKTIVADENTFETSIPGVFAGGDAINDGPSIAIAAVGHAKRGAKVINSYLAGKIEVEKKPFICQTGERNEEEYAQIPKRGRMPLGVLHPDFRKEGMLEVTQGYDPEEAVMEASRCLECGCLAVYDCKLLEYARKYDADPEPIKGEVNKYPVDQSHPFIIHDNNKCILCGNCVRTCEEVTGCNTLGLLDRGFNTSVEADFGVPMGDSSCRSCGACVAVCPTGALQEKQPWLKSVPLDTECVSGVCNFCGNGCALTIKHKGDVIDKVVPAENGRLCTSGRFGFPSMMTATGDQQAAVKYDSMWMPVAIDGAVMGMNAAVMALRESYGMDTLALAVGDQLTTEEIFMVRHIADILETEAIYAPNATVGGLSDVLGRDGSTVSLEDLAAAQMALVIGTDILSHYPMLAARMKAQAKKGQKSMFVVNGEFMLSGIADKTVALGEDLAVLKAIEAALKGEDAPAEIVEIAAAYKNAESAVLIFDRSRCSREAAQMMANIAVLAGKVSGNGSGILQLRARTNSQGVADMGITKNIAQLKADILSKEVKGLLLFGVDLTYEFTSDLQFLGLADTVYGRAYSMADVIIPWGGFGGATGSYTNFEGKVQKVKAAIGTANGMENWEVLAAMSNKYKKAEEVQTLADLEALVVAQNAEYGKTLAGEAVYTWEGAEFTAELAEPCVDAQFAVEYEDCNEAVKKWQQVKNTVGVK